jgi:hypothetical protein
VKRVPLADLRTAFSNPGKYAKTFTGQSGGGGPSKYGMFLHAIGEFHRTNNLQEAQEYLQRTIERNFKNIGDLPDYARKLQVYAREFRQLGNTFVRVRDMVEVPIATEFAEFVVSGQAARFDLVPTGGYAAWVFVRDVPDWRDDPRMPLMQLGYSKKLGVATEEVLVGVYDFDAGAHSTERFSTSQINRARRNLRGLLALLKERFK